VMRLMPTELSSHETGNVDMQLRKLRRVARIEKNRDLNLSVNLLAPELFFLILAHLYINCE